jgi:hypothetical protein
VGFVLPKSITEDRVPHQIIFGRYDELNLAPFQHRQPAGAGVFPNGRSDVAPYEGDSPGWMRSRG